MAVRKLTLVLDLNSGQFSTRIVDATGQLKTFNTHVAKTNASLKSASRGANEFGTAMRDVHHSLSFVHVVLAAITSTVGGFTVGLVKMNAEAQRSVALLEGLSKRTDSLGRRMEAVGDFKFLRKFATEAPYSLDVLTDTFVKLKSVGIDPTQGAMKALIDGIANFGGSNEELHRAAVAIQQMSGKGVISMEELRQQLGEAMPTALRVMAKAAGMSVRAFVKEVSKGKVEAEGLIGTTGKFWAELERENAGAADRMAKTFSGQINIIKTNIQGLALAIGGFQGDGSFERGGFMDTLIGQSKDLNQWLTDPETLRGAKEFGHDLAEVLKAAADLVNFMVSHAGVIKVFAEGFLLFKGVELAQSAMRSMLSMVGLTVGANGQLANSAVVARIKQLEFYKAVATGKAVMLDGATAAHMKAVTTEEAVAQEVAAIQSEIAVLREEAAQYEANIALAREQKIAATQAAYAAQQRKIAGVGEFGALMPAGASSVKTAAKEALDAEAAIVANRKNLQRVTGELAVAEDALAVSAGRLTIAQRAVAVATTAAGLAARAGTAAIAGLNFVLDLLGGPIIGTALISLGLFALAMAQTRKAIEDMEEAERAKNAAIDDSKNAMQEANDALEQSGNLMHYVEQKTGQLSGTTDAFAKAQETAVGSVKNLNKELVIQAEKARVATIAQLQLAQANLIAARTSMDKSITDQRSRSVTSDEVPAVTRTLRGPVGEPGARAAMGGQALFGSDPDTQAKAMGQRGDAEIKRLTAIRDGMEPKIKQIQDQIVALQGTTTAQLIKEIQAKDRDDNPDLGTGDSGKPKRHKISPAERLEDQTTKLESSKTALRDLLDSLDQGSKAADAMRAKIAVLRKEGAKISPEAEARAVEAARSAANLDQAYNNLNEIFNTSKEQADAASDAYADLGKATDSIDNSTDKFARKLQLMRDQITAADPELAKDTERMKKLDDTIAQSKADFRFVQIAQSVAQLTAQLDKLKNHTVNPDLDSWGDWQDQIDAINQDLENIKKAREDLAGMSDGAEKEKRLKELDDAEKQALDNRARYSDNYIDHLEFNLEQEVQANKEALMTADEARQAAYQREIDRINALTDVSKMSAEERAKYEARMMKLREDATAAATARLNRDIEGPMGQMVRDYTDTTARMKELQGEWFQDFMEKMKSGEMDFGDFVLKMIEDYLWMIAQAKMASMIQQGGDALMNMASQFFGGGQSSGPNSAGNIMAMLSQNANLMQGNNNNTGPAQSGNSGAWLQMAMQFMAAMFHTGGVGGQPSMQRAADPNWFTHAPRFHQGRIPGLKKGELPAIIKDDEGVFTPGQMKALGAAANGGNREPPKVEINLINQSGQPLDADQGGGRFDGESYIIDVVVNAMGKNGRMRNAIMNTKK